MALVDFTSFNDIRAALGVAEAEIGDSTLSLALYENNLTSEFAVISSTLVTAFTDLPAADTRSAEQTSFAMYVQLFATYAVARQLTVSLPLFSPKEIGDGKATMTRYALDPYKATVQGVNEQYEKFKTLLIAAFETLNPVTETVVPVLSYFGVASPTTDPITGT